jgi:hypothetical protein
MPEAVKHRSKGKKDTEDAEAGNEPKPGSRPKNSRSITNLILSRSNINVLDHDPRALMVVVNPEAKMMNFWALCNPDADGLCETFKVGKEEVFFAPQYRDDDVTVTEYRRTSWPNKISLTLQELLGPTKSLYHYKNFLKSPNLSPKNLGSLLLFSMFCGYHSLCPRAMKSNVSFDGYRDTNILIVAACQKRNQQLESLYASFHQHPQDIQLRS